MSDTKVKAMLSALGTIISDTDIQQDATVDLMFPTVATV
jgi:hypothetical protein